MSPAWAGGFLTTLPKGSLPDCLYGISGLLKGQEGKLPGHLNIWLKKSFLC